MKAFLITFSCLLTFVSAQLDMTSDRMGFEDNIAEESSHSDEKVFATKPILNDGRPFFVARDPNTGSLDFNQKKTAGITNDIPRETKDELSGFSKSGHDIGSLGNDFFHDKLNLPVKYSSSKFVIPLISGSYANLKYQGNNKNQDSNHKNYTSTLGTTQPPRYYTHVRDHTFTATFKHPTTTTPKTPAPTTKATTSAPTRKHVEESTTFRTPASTKSPVTVSTTTETPKTTIKYSSTIVQQNQFPSTFKNYVDSSETRRKTTQKIVESSTTRVSPIRETKPPAHPVKFIDEDYSKPTTYRPPLSHETRLSFSTSMPILKPSAFKPVGTTEAPRNQSQKIVFETGSKNPSVMTLSDIFNSITKIDHDSIPYDTAESNRHPQIEIKTLPPALSTSTPKVTLQTQNMKTQQQFVDLPVYQPSQYPPHHSQSHIEFPTDESAFEDYVEFENPADNKYANKYVKYEVHKPVSSNSSPNPNLVAFKQIPSINNVVISPSQNSASFVLGSQQSVGSVGVGSSMGVGTNEFVSSANGPMKVGQVINDAPPVRSNQMQANIRFPGEGSSNFDNAQIVKGTIKIEGTSSDVVQPPQALSQNKPAQQQKPLVFPSNSISKPTSNNVATHGGPILSSDPSKVIFENVNDIYEKVNDKKQKQESMSNELAGNIAVGELKPPSFNQQSQSTQYPFVHQQYPHSPPPQFVRRPGPGPSQHRQPPRPPVYHQQLPNILPQFRPNSKASHGHPQAFQDHGSIRVQSQYSQAPPPFLRHPYPAPKIGLPSMMSPPPPSAMMSSQSVPSSANPSNFRHGPQPTRRIINRANGPNPYPQESANRRIYRPQSAALTSSHSMNDLTYMKPPPAPNFQLKRILTGKPETLQMLHRPQSIPQQQQHVSDVELNKSLPPAPSTMLSSIEEEVNGTILEPVVTLQMLQSKKTSGGKLNLPPVPHDVSQDLHAELLPSNHKEESGERFAAKKPSVYVVYPVQSHSSFENPQALKDEEKDGREPSIISEYQNTPFSVVSHFEQEPLLMKKDKKRYPAFPYHLEKPQKTQLEMKSDLQRPMDINYDASIYNIGEQPMMNMNNENPDAISSKLVRATERPIAIAYTPTEPNRVYTPTNFYRPNNQYSHYYDPHLSSDKFSNPNFGRPVISEILDDKRLNLDFSQRPPQHVPQAQRQPPPPPPQHEAAASQQEHFDFQAPFQASVSVNPEVTNPYEGWAVVTQATDTNKIDRSDMFGVEDETTKRFELTDFQPMFESGFKPIYSERRVSLVPEIEAESDEMFAESDESTEAIQSAKLVETSPARIEIVHTSPSTTTSFETSSEISKSTSSSNESTTQVVEKEKKKVEIDSLEAFFDSLTRDYDDDNDAESTNKSENESRSL